MTSMLTWQGADGRSLEATRLGPPAAGLRALGRMVRVVPDEPPFSASYRIFSNETGGLKRVSLTSVTAERERHLTLNRTEDGYWLLDTGTGGSAGSRAEFDGALDVDLAFSPMFNTLPIRRLELHKRSGEQQIPVVFVALPTLAVEVVSQRYRTVSIPAAGSGDNAVVAFSSGGFAADLVVDDQGYVIDYPGLAHRI